MEITKKQKRLIKLINKEFTGTTSYEAAIFINEWLDKKLKLEERKNYEFTK